MSQKVFSIGVDGKLTHKLSTPVRYRVYTNDARISPQGAECVIWNQVSFTLGKIKFRIILLPKH